MITRKIATGLFFKQPIVTIRNENRRNVQISIIGGAGEIGSNLAVLLKQNYKVSIIKLYDDEQKVKGYATEMNLLPGGPKVMGYTAGEIIPAICDVDIVVVTSRVQGAPGKSKIPVLETNAPTVQAVCNAVAAYNPSVFLALCIEPLNSIVPFAASVLYRHNAFNPFKVLGITHIDTSRCKSLAGSVLKANPRQIRVPVIGGHSEDTVVPLFSNLTPTFYSINSCQADMLTRLLRRASYDTFKLKRGKDSSSISMAYSINEFCQGIIDALSFGTHAELHCFAANPHFGTRYFAGPNLIGPYGISQTPNNFNMSNLECSMLSEAIRNINRDVKAGEELFDTVMPLKSPISRKYIPRQALPSHTNSIRPSEIHQIIHKLT